MGEMLIYMQNTSRNHFNPVQSVYTKREFFQFIIQFKIMVTKLLINLFQEKKISLFRVLGTYKTLKINWNTSLITFVNSKNSFYCLNKARTSFLQYRREWPMDWGMFLAFYLAKVIRWDHLSMFTRWIVMMMVSR